MATFNKFNSFVEALAEKLHDLGANVLKIALTNTAPVATNTVHANLTTPITTNVATLSDDQTGMIVKQVTSAQSSGVYKLCLYDIVITATGGAIATFRYVVLYNSTATNSELIGWYDYGVGGVTLLTGETLTVDFDPTAGVLTIT